MEASNRAKCWLCWRQLANMLDSNGKMVMLDHAGKISCEMCATAVYCSVRCMKEDSRRHRFECLMIARPCSHCGTLCNQPCNVCHYAWYCNEGNGESTNKSAELGSRCSQQHRKEHESFCTEVATYSKLFRYYIDNVEAPQRNSYLPWYWSNAIAVDYLNLLNNELSTSGASESSETAGNRSSEKDGINAHETIDAEGKSLTLKLLFLGVGELSNVFKTISSLPDAFTGRLEFVLNDTSPHILARNILFLYFMLTGTTSHASDVMQDNHTGSAGERSEPPGGCGGQLADQLVQIYYSLAYADETKKLLVEALQRLCAMSARELSFQTGGALNIQEESFDSIKRVFRGWLKASEWMHLSHLHVVRRAQFAEVKCKESTKVYQEGFSSSEQRNSVSLWLETGLLLARDDSMGRDEAVHPNVTLTCFNPEIYHQEFTDLHDPTHRSCPIVGLKYDFERKVYPVEVREHKMVYGIRGEIHPFLAWDYFQVQQDDLEGILDKDLPAAYRNHMSRVIRKVIERVLSRQSGCGDGTESEVASPSEEQEHHKQGAAVTFRLILGDTFRVVRDLNENGETFDRIDTTNLLDYVRYVDELLQPTANLLNPQNPYATLVMQSIYWQQVFLAVRKEYEDLIRCTSPDLDVERFAGKGRRLNGCWEIKSNAASSLRIDQIMHGVNPAAEKGQKSMKTEKVSNENGATQEQDNGHYSPHDYNIQHQGEYLNFAADFITYLRSRFQAKGSQTSAVLGGQKDTGSDREKVLGPGAIFGPFEGLQMRDFTKGENRIRPFRWRSSVRPANLVEALSQAIEWRVALLQQQTPIGCIQKK